MVAKLGPQASPLAALRRGAGDSLPGEVGGELAPVFETIAVARAVAGDGLVLSARLGRAILQVATMILGPIAEVRASRQVLTAKLTTIHIIHDVALLALHVQWLVLHLRHEASLVTHTVAVEPIAPSSLSLALVFVIHKMAKLR